MDYSDRVITGVDVWGLNRVKFDDTTFGVNGTVRFTMSNWSGEDNGPSATVDLGVECVENPTIEEAERALISGALEIVAQFGKNGPDLLVHKLKHGRENAFIKKVES